MAPPAHLPRLGLLLLFGLSLGWGINWPFMKIALLEIPLWQYRSISCVAAGLSMLALSHLAGNPIRLPRRQWAAFGLSTLFNVTAWHIFTAYGVLMMASGRAAIIAFTMPVWAALLAVLVLGERLDRRGMLALVLGIAGIAALLNRDLGAIGESPWGALFMLGAALSWAAGTIVQKRVAWETPIMALAGWQLLLGSTPIVVIALMTEPLAIHEAGPKALAAMAYTTFVALVLCYYAWLKIVSLFPANIAAIGTLSIPALGLVSGAVLLAEPLGWREILAAGLVVSSLALVLLRPAAAAPNSVG